MELNAERLPGNANPVINVQRSKALGNLELRMIPPLLKWALVAFVFSIPFDSVRVGDDNTAISVPKIIGVAFLGICILNFKFIQNPFGAAMMFFGIYILILTFGLLTIETIYFDAGVSRIITLVQLAALFWIFKGIFRHPIAVKTTAQGFSIATGMIALSSLTGFTSAENVLQAGEFERVTALDNNANRYAVILAVATAASVWLIIGKWRSDKKIEIVSALLVPILTISLFKTGSRSGVVCLMAGLLAYMIIKEENRRIRIIRSIGFFLLGGILVYLFQNNEMMLFRFQKTLMQGDLSGRDDIYRAAIDMFSERPLAGWGLVKSVVVLGNSLNMEFRDPHNLILWLLIEGGIVCFVPFGVGLFLCLKNSWKHRNNHDGSLAFVLIVMMMVANMSGTLIYVKMFWIIMALAIAQLKPFDFQRA